jgi:hypothetical protein
LLLAWSLSSVTKDLHTADYLASLISGTVAPAYFPMLVFVLGAIISLSTGSSYGTFAILMAIAVPVGFELDASMYLTIAAVLSGGLMGDHVSPISDTTVLASVGANCNHLDHVTTQAAYAGLTGLVTILAYWMAGIYQSPYVLFIAVIVVMPAGHFGAGLTHGTDYLTKYLPEELAFLAPILGEAKVAEATADGDSVFANEILPVLEAKCFECHSTEKQDGELRLDSLEACLAGGESGLPSIVRGEAFASYMVELMLLPEANEDVSQATDADAGVLVLVLR